MKYSIKGNIFLLMAAVVWGCGLVAQKAGMSHLGAFGFTAVRHCIGDTYDVSATGFAVYDGWEGGLYNCAIHIDYSSYGNSAG